MTSVVHGESELLTGGLAEPVPFLVCGFNSVPQSSGSALADGVGALCAGGVTHPGTIALGDPCLRGAAVVGDEHEVVPPTAGKGECGEELEGASFVGNDIGWQARVPLLAVRVFGVAKRSVGRIVAVV